MGSARFVALSLRLGLFQACLGALSVLTLGIFNRLLIDEFEVPAALTALALGSQQLVAFTRVWFGQRSDRCRWRGLRRTPFILGGAAAFCTLTWVAGRTVLWIAEASQQGDSSSVVLRGLVLAVVFLFYGIAISASSTPFAALLVDVSTEKQRPALVSVVWSMLMVGIVAGAILLSAFLGSSCASDGIDAVISGVDRLVSVAPWVIFVLVLVSIAGVEPQQASQLTNTDSNQQHGTGDLAGGCLAGASLVTTGGVFLRRALLVYLFIVLAGSGAGALRRCCLWHGRLHNDTTECDLGCWHPARDCQHWFSAHTATGRTAHGLGGWAVISMLCGADRGCWIGGSESLFRASLFLFGAAAGISTNASLTLMLGLTSPLMAGTFIGVWGLAQAYARGLATISGGALLSGFGTLTGSQNSFAAYAGVFIIQAIGLLVAGLLLLRVDTKLFQRRVEKALSSILASELD